LKEHLEIRDEAFDITNTPNFSNPQALRHKASTSPRQPPSPGSTALAIPYQENCSSL
jgi:hypothetical protein